MNDKPTFVFKSSQNQIHLVTEMDRDGTVLPMEHLRDPLGLSSYLYKFMLVFYEKWLS